MENILKCLVFFFSFILFSLPVNALDLDQRLSGRILLQVEQKGKAWYVNPADKSRSYLGRPADAFRVMREQGLGITNTDLGKIALSDKLSVTNTAFAKKLAGKILLQVQQNGEAWYVNPVDFKRYFLGRPSDAFQMMRGLGLGVADNDLKQVSVADKYADPEQPITKKQGFPASIITKPSSSQSVAKSASLPITNYAAFVGSYRCWSYNVSGGGGGDCRLFAPIVLNADGTYSVSSEKGTYTVVGDIINLSESKLRGPGKLVSGNQIRFEYDYNGWHHTITYLKESGSSTSSGSSTAIEVPVQITLEYGAKDSSLNSIVDLELVVEGENIKTASYIPTAIAVWDGDRRVTASFHKANATPRTGKKYDVYANWGREQTKVGTIDLTNATTQIITIIKVLESGSSTVQQKEEAPSTAPEIVVEIDLVYPSRDSSLGSIQFITLVPQGQDPAVAVYKPMALAVWDGDRTVVGSFHKMTNQVKTKAVYDIYADWGPFGGYVKSGTLDLSATSVGPMTKQVQTTITGK